MWAIQAGHTNSAVALIDRGADIHARDSKCCTPLHYAATKCNAPVVSHLLSVGAAILARDCDNATALHMAAAAGARECVEALLSVGADPMVTDAEGQTPLHHAAAAGHLEVCATLLDAGATLAVDTEGRTPFVCAALHRHSGVLALLTEHAQCEVERQRVEPADRGDELQELTLENRVRLLEQRLLLETEAHNARVIRMDEKLKASQEQLEDERFKTMCQICMDKPRDTLLLPCVHFLYCSACVSKALAQGGCPACRTPVSGKLHVKLSL
eukprot:TRINITY_DN9259_c0_g1_i2.p1 TRINITY_DN9259_c0_g1~~TRINITY_DN9259_c0_g1_i2.p1  ORF type:complete len:270 (+),score=62.84 TRINITY_DN9259_c0_g1_i2:786-1595(+)